VAKQGGCNDPTPPHHPQLYFYNLPLLTCGDMIDASIEGDHNKVVVSDESLNLAGSDTWM